ncbi:MAG: histidinol-phosphatase HisJ family protein [Clostridia bacterium]|nr:histidinol-phosphatase HisJ family protein [Clostridia bacterium]
MIDRHNHSRFSFDSDACPEDEIVKAIKKGVKIYGFAEHVYLFDNTDLQCEIDRLREYVEYVERLKPLFHDVKILHGVEYNFDAPHEKQYRILSDSVRFDYVINSVHCVGDLNLYGDYFSRVSLEKGYELYFDTVMNSLDAGYDYQIVGHFGNILKIGRQFSPEVYFEKYKSRIAEILTEIIKRDKTLEVNTSGGGIALSIPNREVLELYYRLGGRKISFGADAHNVESVSKNIDAAIAVVKKIGFGYATYYENKQEKRYLL